MRESEMLPIRYSGFWDVPSAFYTLYNGEVYFFWRDYFDEDLDDYPPNYQVYLIKEVSFEDASKIWDLESISNKSLVGEVPTKEVIFDESKRQYISSLVFEAL
ncbi:MAG: hypothetical protein KF881_11685 [Acidobacteria bacterium]|nr:hypothetical protein [Acidobacteriota bacterium]